MTTAITEKPVLAPPRHSFVIFVLAFFAGWPSLKYANVQFLEVFMLAHLMFLAIIFGLRGFKARIGGLWVRPGEWYGLVMLTVLIASVSSLRLQRFPPMYGPYFLNYPLLVVALRYIELFLVVFYSLYAAELMRRDGRLRDFALRTYLASALVTCWLSMVGIVLLRLTGIGLWVNGEARAQGEFPEGGPFGLYLLTATIVAYVLWKRGRMSQAKLLVTVLTLGWAVVACRSKACFLCAFMIFLTQIFFGHSMRQKVASAVAITAVCLAGWYIFDVPVLYRFFLHLRQTAEFIVFLNPGDGNIAYGRVAGAAIIPRMIEHHPLTGIGLGNYSVMRNDPAYLGLIHPVRYYDLPGLGLLWVAAELGIPCLLLLYGMMMYPAFRVRKLHGNAALLMLALCQPYVHLMGAQITLFYPWLSSAFVLSFLPLSKTARKVARAGVPMRKPLADTWNAEAAG